MTAKTVLVVAAHPDDEVLGCGATSAWHATCGDRVEVLILGEGATSRASTDKIVGRRDEVTTLQAAATTAAKILGTCEPRFVGLADNRMDEEALLQIVKVIEAVVSEVRPAVIYTHFGGDLNVDHQIVHAAVLTACRPLPQSSVREIHTYETLSSTEWAATQQHRAFEPNLFVDVGETLDRKLQALTAYHDEMRHFPHPRSLKAVEALAHFRGASVGLSAAEAFATVRRISGPGRV